MLCDSTKAGDHPAGLNSDRYTQQQLFRRLLRNKNLYKATTRSKNNTVLLIIRIIIKNDNNNNNNNNNNQNLPLALASSIGPIGAQL